MLANQANSSLPYSWRIYTDRIVFPQERIGSIDIEDMNDQLVISVEEGNVVARIVMVGPWRDAFFKAMGELLALRRETG
jgi:hypothetical protein